MANSVGEDKICVERDVERWFKSIHVHKEMRKEKKRKGKRKAYIQVKTNYQKGRILTDQKLSYVAVFASGRK